MIGYIKGQIVDKGDGYLLIDNGGIGYQLFVSSSTLTQVGDKAFVQLYTYMSVREDAITLYGFYTKEEKTMFLKLTSVSGIGPKGALSILSGIELNKLMVSIINKDIKSLSKIKGIGKKTAERIIVELKENLDASFNSVFDDENTTINEEKDELDNDCQDAIYALRGLGFTQNEALKAVKSARPKARDLQELISISLRSLN